MRSISLTAAPIATPGRRPACRVALAGVAMGAALTLSGCGVDYASSEPVFPGSPETRHPIVLAESPTALKVYPVGGGLDARTRADLRDFAERYKRFGTGEIAILVPGRPHADSGAVREIRGALGAAGLRGRVSVGSYAVDSDDASPIRVEFIGLKAEVKTRCGLWPEDLASGSSLWGWKNEPYSNFGCANQSMLAAQVDDPRDLVQSRALGPSDVAMRTRAIVDVRNGADPGTHWSTDLTPIGTTPGGN